MPLDSSFFAPLPSESRRRRRSGARKDEGRTHPPERATTMSPGFGSWAWLTSTISPWRMLSSTMLSSRRRRMPRRAEPADSRRCGVAAHLLTSCEALAGLSGVRTAACEGSFGAA